MISIESEIKRINKEIIEKLALNLNKKEDDIKILKNLELLKKC